MSELDAVSLSTVTESINYVRDAAKLLKINEINDTCIENLTQNLNNIKKSINLQQAAAAAAALNEVEEIYENHQHPDFKTALFNRPHLDPRIQKQLNLLNELNGEACLNSLTEAATTSHELYINPIAKNITQFALESCELEKKIAAKFNKKPNPKLGNLACF